MKISARGSDCFEILLSKEDLGTVGNCLNEVCNGIEVFEFQTRIGVSREQVSKLLDTIVKAYRGEE